MPPRIPKKLNFAVTFEQKLNAFIDAAGAGNMAAVKRFLDTEKYAVAINEERRPRTWGSGTALMMAIKNGQKDIVEFLLERGASIQGDHGRKALLQSARDGSREIAEMLLRKGADIDGKDSVGRTALIEAAWYGRENNVELLLEKGADIDVEDGEGHTALMCAMVEGHTEVVRLIEEHSQRLEAEKHARWLDDTDCSQGLKKAIPAPRPPRFSKKSPAI